jgi:membrane-associated phospholipid phosphatase
VLDSERNYVAHHRRVHLGLRPDTPHWWLPTLATLVAVYALLTVLVLVGSPIDAVDARFYQLNLVPASSPWHLFVDTWVFLGQRAPAMVLAGAYTLYRCRKLRIGEPIATFLMASFLFVATVAILKYSTGRIGPRFTSDAYTAFAGGHIFPSGHVTGAVVMYGFIAMSAPAVHRRVMTWIAVVMSVTVGMGTVAMNTHWASDVVGAWIDGALVLMVAWAATPWVSALAKDAYQYWRPRARTAPQTDHPRPHPRAVPPAPAAPRWLPQPHAGHQG